MASAILLDTLTITAKNALYPAIGAQMEVVVTEWQTSGHVGNITIWFDIYDLRQGFPDQLINTAYYPSAPNIPCNGRLFKITYADLNTITMEVWAEVEPKYTCVDGNCMQRSTSTQTLSECQATCKANPPTQGFIFTADKEKDSVAFQTIGHISYPGHGGETINLVRQMSLPPNMCIQDVILDSDGKADVNISVTESSQTLYFSAGVGCCVADIGQCTTSNRIVFSSGTDWITTALYAVGLLAAAYVAGQYISNRNKGKVK